MRKTLHEYVIELSKEYRNDFDCAFRLALSHANLTNRAPKLGDFIGKYAIFKGDWEYDGELGVDGRGYEVVKYGEIAVWFHNYKKVGVYIHNRKITRIEDLPREIEFKEEVI